MPKTKPMLVLSRAAELLLSTGANLVVVTCAVCGDPDQSGDRRIGAWTCKGCSERSSLKDCSEVVDRNSVRSYPVKCGKCNNIEPKGYTVVGPWLCDSCFHASYTKPYQNVRWTDALSWQL